MWTAQVGRGEPGWGKGSWRTRGVQLSSRDAWLLSLMGGLRHSPSAQCER